MSDSTAPWQDHLNLQSIKAAHERISPFIHRTPVLTCAALDKLTGRKVFMKAECFQKTGSFKARGALNAVMLAKQKPGCKGVVTHSSGNHGQGLAWAATLAALPSCVITPDVNSHCKKENMRNYGAEVVECQNTYTSRAETCQKEADERGYTFISACNDYDILSGQGTIGLELLEQVPELDAVLVPVSGGGMIAGIAAAVKAIKPSVRVYACEPVGKDLQPSLVAGKRLWEGPNDMLDTVAEGIRVHQPGSLIFPVMCDAVEKTVFTLTDDEMITAMKFAWQRVKAVIEVSSGAGLAAVMSPAFRDIPEDVRNVGVILCGGNADLDNIPWIK